MEHLTVYKTPPVKAEYLITALAGWADAAEAATAGVRYLVRHFKAKRFAELDPEEFYDFSHVRPYTSLTRDDQRRLRWPANELFYCTTGKPKRGLLFFLGVEPSLKWRTYADTIVGLAQQWGVSTVVHAGAVLDAVPHTREMLLTGSSNRSDFTPKLEKHNLRPSNYQGPAGISSALMEACSRRELSFATVWGHTPHYIQAAPNYKASYSLLKVLSSLLGFKMDFSELESAAARYQEMVGGAIVQDSQLSTYVSKLEERYDDAQGEAREMPLPEEAVRDLETFLKERQRPGGSGGLLS